MPTKTATKPKPKPPVEQKINTVARKVAKGAEREVPFPIGDTLVVNGIPIPIEKLRITRQQGIDLLGWDDEASYIAGVETRYDDEEGNPTLASRQVSRDKPKTAAKDFGENYDLLDLEGHKVRLNNNQGNRPLKTDHFKSLAHDLLNGNWAGYSMGEGMTVNGETMIFDSFGDCESGQHRLVAYEWAWQMWDKAKLTMGDEHPWVKIWPNGPVMESLVVQGISSDSKVKRTLDNVMPRSVADVFYTSDIFQGQNLLNADRAELAGMLGNCVDWLWQRTGRKHDSSKNKVPQTHSESVMFVDQHGGKTGHLVRAVKHMWDTNGGDRRLKQQVDSNGKEMFEKNPDGTQGKPVMYREGRALTEALGGGGPTAGKCAALLWLMATSCMTNEETEFYFQDPKDETLAWKTQEGQAMWELACEFWSTLANMSMEELAPLRTALACLVDPDTASSGRELEKVAVIAKAWHLFKDGESLTFERPKPDTLEDGTEVMIPASGNFWLEESFSSETGARSVTEDPWPTFGGVDKFEAPTRAKDKVLTPEEVVAAKAKEDAEREEQNRIAEIKAAQKRIDAARRKAGDKPAAQPTTIPASEASRMDAKKKLLADTIAKRQEAARVAAEAAANTTVEEPNHGENDIPY